VELEKKRKKKGQVKNERPDVKLVFRSIHCRFTAPWFSRSRMPATNQSKFCAGLGENLPPVTLFVTIRRQLSPRVML